MLMTVISYVTKPPFTHIGLKPKQFEYREQLYYKFLQVDSELKLLKRINIWDPRYKTNLEQNEFTVHFYCVQCEIINVVC